MDEFQGLTWAGELPLMEFGELIGEAEDDGSWDDLQDAHEAIEDLKILKGSDASWQLERDYPEKWAPYFAEAMERKFALAKEPGFQMARGWESVTSAVGAQQLIADMNQQAHARIEARASAANRIGFDLAKRLNDLSRPFNVRARRLLRSGAVRFIGSRKDILADEVSARWASSLAFRWFEGRIVLPKEGTAVEQIWERVLVAGAAAPAAAPSERPARRTGPARIQDEDIVQKISALMKSEGLSALAAVRKCGVPAGEQSEEAFYKRVRRRLREVSKS